MTERLNIGMVGLGFGVQMIEGHVLAGPGRDYFRLAAVCDADPERLARAASRYGVRACLELDELLADGDIPVIGLFTGPGGRAALLRKIIRAGKDVMTTKPFELDAEAAASVLAEARDLGRVIHLNSPSSCLNDDFRQIEAWREAYGLGRPVAARHECWYKSVEQADGRWYDDPERCPAAPILRLGIYGVNDLLQVFGEAESVQVTETRLFTGRPTPDLAMMTLKFRNGGIAETLDGWCLQPQRGAHSLTVYYEGGTVHRNPVLLGEDGIEVETFKMCVVPAARHDGTPAEVLTMHRQQLSDAYRWDVFHRAIRGKAPEDETPPERIVHAVRVLEAMKRASKSGKTEAVR